MKTNLVSIFALLILLAIGCKSLNTNLSLPEKKIPESYHTVSADTSTIAKINWREYFDDTNLIKLIDTALAGNLDLLMTLQRIEVARAGTRSAKGALLPQAGVNINGGVRKFGLYTMDGAGNISTEILPGKIVPINLPDMYVGLNASWEADIWGKLQNKRKSAQASYLASIEGANYVISNLVADVAISYYELIALDNELEIIRQTIQKQQEALDVIKLKKETGRVNELAVQQFQAQLLNSQALEFEFKQQILEQENRINFLLGRYPQTIQRSQEALFKDIPQKFASGIPSQLLANRPDIREAELQVTASKFDLKAAKAAFFPSINITSGIGFQAFNPQFLFISPASLAYSTLGGLVAPLVNMNALKAHFHTAKSNQLTAMYNYQKTILNGYVEVANELSSLENLNQISLLKRQQREVLVQSVEISTELYKSVKVNYLEVLVAQQNLLQTQLDVITVKKRQLISTVNIYKALGGGWR